MKTRTGVMGTGSIYARYQQVIVGEIPFLGALYYEFCIWLKNVPGALGLLLRKLFWPPLFGSCGRGVMFSENVVLRHPRRIHLGDKVIVSEGCILDARCFEPDYGIFLDDEVLLSNSVMISCKRGSVKIGARTGIGAQTIIHSTSCNEVVIGEMAAIGPKCYIVGGGNYDPSSPVPYEEQEPCCDGGVKIGNNVWLGAGVIVLSGVSIGSGSVAGAGSVVTRSVPEGVLCAGVPALIKKKLEKKLEKKQEGKHTFSQEAGSAEMRGEMTSAGGSHGA